MHRSRSALQPGVSHPSVVLVPVLLIAVACSGGDGLRPEPGSVVALAFSQFLDSVPQGQPIPSFRVVTVDANNQVVATSPKSIAVAVENGSGPGTAGGTTSATTVAGTATFDDVRISLPGRSYRLRATSPGLTDVISAPFVVTIPFASLRAGSGDTCGAESATQVYCWGETAAWLAGAGVGMSLVPRQLTTPLAFQELAVGLGELCGVVASAGTYCWGQATTTPNPTLLPGAPQFVRLALSRHRCGIRADGVTLCWGDNENGQLGQGVRGSATDVPAAVTGGHTFQDIAVGFGHTCALEGSTAYCWGNNSFGQLGNGGVVLSSVPVPVSGGLQFSRIYAGAEFTCGITTSGPAYCWGKNFHSQLGSGTTVTQSTVPLAVAGGVHFTALALGGEHACGLDATRDAYCWGWNVSGEVTGSDSPVGTPIKVARIHGKFGFDAIVAGDYHTCGRTTPGLVYCWGTNGSGQLGNGGIIGGPVPRLVLPP